MQKIINKLTFIFLIQLLLFIVCFGEAFAAEAEKAEQDLPVNVSADKLVSDRNARYAEFIGSVVATRGGSKLTSKKLKIFYAENKEKKDNEESGAVDRMIAEGDVVLTFEDKIAVAEKAVYTAADDSIVLSGGAPKVTSGSSFVAGEQITLYRMDGRVIVNGSVNSVFHPKDKELTGKEKNGK